ncbi:uncharacterized protein L203_101680 [Cryptococcus depauperatus CBS 7841]|uniref:CAP-Gly domain-containing protein n=1 Tax=Cryptococcus depauperatus CBS 7841 TaxID=1295531 RepID=A0AAJ8JQK1_9TREE
MASQEVPIGARVQVTAGNGYVRWTGTNPGFAAGSWVGVELFEPTGKNDGSVKGERYFDCKPNHGVFVRPNFVKILEAPLKVAATPRPLSTRPPSTNRLTSASSSRATSPQKPPIPRSDIPSSPSRALSRSSSSSGFPSSPVPSKGRISTSSFLRASQSNIFKRPPSVLGDARARTPLTATTKEDEPLQKSTSPTRRTMSSAPTRDIPSVENVQSLKLNSPPIKSQEGLAQKKELEELRIRVRVLENKKTEDQERIKSLEDRVEEADVSRAARAKLQAKFQEAQHSLLSSQRQARDLESENSILEHRTAEALDQLEMAALDREVAEEKAEAAETEVAKLSERIAELELEVTLLKEENAEYENPVSGLEGERTSLAFVQLEKHNERLKEALIRLRDVSSEAEREYKTKMAELEKELMSQEDLASRLELSEAKLANAGSQIEDLKMQLDDALGAEDMLEQLTERNLQMSERIEEMRATIEDLEALKDLNDELEEGHVETEKQLHEEVEQLTSRLGDERVKSEELDALVIDMEGTISQFRELVASLQGELEDVRIQKISQESDSATTTKEAHALMNLNLKLQSTAAKAQSKTIDLELKKLEAIQLAEHLRIVQAYLPNAYHDTEENSTSMFLFFNRMAAKVDMLINVISQMHGLPTALHSASSDALVGICELKGKLRHFCVLNKRFAAIMRRGNTEEWLRYGKFVGEVAGVETRIDGWLNGLKGDAFNESDCARELGSLIAQFDHLAEASFDRPMLDVGEQQLGLAHGFDCDLDNFAAAVGFAKQAIASLAAEEDIEVDVGDTSLEEGIYDPVQRILDLVRNIKAPSSKMLSQIEQAVQASSSFLPEVTLLLDELSASVSNAVDLAVQLAQRIGQHVATLRSSKEPLRLSDIETFLQDVTAQSASAAPEAHPWELIGAFVSKLGEQLGAALSNIRESVKEGSLLVLDAPAPWLARVAAIKEAASHNPETEKQVVKLSEEVKDMLREIRIRDQSLQEAGVKVETLERRLEASRKQGDIIVELESDVAKAKKQEKVYEDAIEQLQAEQDALEAENARLRKGQGQSADRQVLPSGVSMSLGEPALASSSSGLESSQLVEQVEILRSTIQFLRSENALLKSKELFNEIHSLPAVTYRSVTNVPELVPSATFSSSTSDSEGSMPVTPTLSPVSLPPPTKHDLEVESRILLLQITKFQAGAKIVDISGLRGEKGWRSRKKEPEVQILEWKAKEKRLERKLEALIARTKLFKG